MNPITLFSWGYYGWGNYTTRLVKAVDAVEATRGFAPPVFVDIRIRRSVRAKGFQGSAFANLLGPERHLWMKGLGNRFIETRVGPEIQIVDPSDAEVLLDHGLEYHQQKKRLLFFCSCQWPCCEGKINCHRRTVVELVIAAAKRRKQPIEVAEWPGGNPEMVQLPVTRSIFQALRKGRVSIPLGKEPELAQLAGLAWGSLVRVESQQDFDHYLVGPAQAETESWYLPVLSRPLVQPIDHLQLAATLRRQFGLESVRVTIKDS